MSISAPLPRSLQQDRVYQKTCETKEIKYLNTPLLFNSASNTCWINESNPNLTTTNLPQSINRNVSVLKNETCLPGKLSYLNNPFENIGRNPCTDVFYFLDVMKNDFFRNNYIHNGHNGQRKLDMLQVTEKYSLWKNIVADLGFSALRQGQNEKILTEKVCKGLFGLKMYLRENCLPDTKEELEKINLQFLGTRSPKNCTHLFKKYGKDNFGMVINNIEVGLGDQHSFPSSYIFNGLGSLQIYLRRHLRSKPTQKCDPYFENTSELQDYMALHPKKV